MKEELSETTGGQELTPRERALIEIKEIISELEEHEQPRVLNDVYDFFYAEHRKQSQNTEMRLKAQKEALETFKYKPIKL